MDPQPLRQKKPNLWTRADQTTLLSTSLSMTRRTVRRQAQRTSTISLSAKSAGLPRRSIWRYLKLQATASVTFCLKTAGGWMPVKILVQSGGRQGVGELKNLFSWPMHSNFVNYISISHFSFSTIAIIETSAVILSSATFCFDHQIR